MWAGALHAAEKAGLAKDSEAWRRMTVFVSRCQNRSESNDQKWASNDGGFVYAPGESKAGEVMLPDGRKGLRSYASMTYAGLMSMIYADVTKDDPRVQAAYEWIRKNYTVDENPGLGPQGLFYYYHTMAKALKAWDDPVLADEKGVRHDWRSDLTEKLLSLQKPDGSWVNANDRWWEKNPVLVTAYVVLTLEELLEK
jgi:squalene-hopene/tetraprenyl-beta-curcumene cyclase